MMKKHPVSIPARTQCIGAPKRCWNRSTSSTAYLWFFKGLKKNHAISELKFLIKNIQTWWNIWSVIKLGDAISGCIRLQAHNIHIEEISQFKAILSWSGNHPTLICYWYMHVVLFFKVRLVLQICILDRKFNKNWSMASEDIWQFKPYDTSKTYL